MKYTLLIISLSSQPLTFEGLDKDTCLYAKSFAEQVFIGQKVEISCVPVPAGKEGVAPKPHSKFIFSSGLRYS